MFRTSFGFSARGIIGITASKMATGKLGPPTRRESQVRLHATDILCDLQLLYCNLSFFQHLGDTYSGPSTKSGVDHLNFDNLALRSLPVDPQTDVYPRQVNPEG